jgi:MFS family permease
MMPANFQFISDAKPTLLQLATMSICFLMNMPDGTKVIIISFTAPVIAKECTVRAQLMGFVFSASLLGLVIGVMSLAPFADRIGRFAMVLISVTLMGMNIFLTAYSQSVVHLFLFSLYTRRQNSLIISQFSQILPPNSRLICG